MAAVPTDCRRAAGRPCSANTPREETDDGKRKGQTSPRDPVGLNQSRDLGNEIEGGGFRHNVQVRRIYKDGEEWKQSDSFGREDLPLVAKVADMAHTWIHQRSQDEA